MDLFARNKQLRHLRIEQFNRYLLLVDSNRAGEETMEDTIDEDTPEKPYKVENECHRHWDDLMEKTSAGTTFKASSYFVQMLLLPFSSLEICTVGIVSLFPL